MGEGAQQRRLTLEPEDFRAELRARRGTKCAGETGDELQGHGKAVRLRLGEVQERPQEHRSRQQEKNVEELFPVREKPSRLPFLEVWSLAGQQEDVFLCSGANFWLAPVQHSQHSQQQVQAEGVAAEPGLRGLRV